MQGVPGTEGADGEIELHMPRVAASDCLDWVDHETTACLESAIPLPVGNEHYQCWHQVIPSLAPLRERGGLYRHVRSCSSMRVTCGAVRAMLGWFPTAGPRWVVSRNPVSIHAIASHGLQYRHRTANDRWFRRFF